MKVILYMAISINGYITRNDDDSDWVSESDWGYFTKVIKHAGVMVMGRKTYELGVEEGVFPFENALNIVMTSDSKLLNKPETKEYLFTNKSPKEVVKLAHEKGFSELLLIGGENLNTSFIEEGLIEEMYLSVHPLVLGKGKRLFADSETELKLSLLSAKEIEEGLVQLYYRVNK